MAKHFLNEENRMVLKNLFNIFQPVYQMIRF